MNKSHKKQRIIDHKRFVRVIVPLLRHSMPETDGKMMQTESLIESFTHENIMSFPFHLDE